MSEGESIDMKAGWQVAAIVVLALVIGLVSLDLVGAVVGLIGAVLARLLPSPTHS